MHRQIIFIVVFLSVLALINTYVYRRFYRQLSPRFQHAGTFMMLAIMAGEVVFVINVITDFFPDSPILYLILSALVGISFMLFVVALLYDLIVSVARRIPFDQERRGAIKVPFDMVIIILTALYLCLGFFQGIDQPEVNTVVVQIEDFPFDGFTIVQLSDLHVGRAIKADFLEEIVSRTNAMQPDMVAITGDLFDMAAENLSKDLAPLMDLDAPAFFVTGNHEYYHGVEPMLELVQTLGIKVLNNQSIRFGNDEDHFFLVGINDLTGARFGVRPPDVETAYANVDPLKPTIVLSHQPKSLSLVEGRRCDLMLSGHTHGGQIFPFGLLVKLDQPYLSGLHEHQPGQQIFVSRGTGYWGPPLRVMAPSEISRIVITRAQ